MKVADLKPSDPAIKALALELIEETLDKWQDVSTKPQDKRLDGFYISCEDGEYVFRFLAHHGQYPEGLPCFEFRPLPVAVAIVCDTLPRDREGMRVRDEEIDLDSMRKKAAREIARMLVSTRDFFWVVFDTLTHIGGALADVDRIKPFDPELQEKIKLTTLQIIDNRFRHLLEIKNKVDENMLDEAHARNGRTPAFTDIEAIRAIEAMIEAGIEPSVKRLAPALNCSRPAVDAWIERRGFDSLVDLVREIKGDAGNKP